MDPSRLESQAPRDLRQTNTRAFSASHVVMLPAITDPSHLMCQAGIHDLLSLSTTYIAGIKVKSKLNTGLSAIYYSYENDSVFTLLYVYQTFNFSLYIIWIFLLNVWVINAEVKMRYTMSILWQSDGSRVLCHLDILTGSN